jgi:hypothetical protein
MASLSTTRFIAGPKAKDGDPQLAAQYEAPSRVTTLLDQTLSVAESSGFEPGITRLLKPPPRVNQARIQRTLF